jgi:hypothetical protein
MGNEVFLFFLRENSRAVIFGFPSRGRKEYEAFYRLIEEPNLF